MQLGPTSGNVNKESKSVRTNQSVDIQIRDRAEHSADCHVKAIPDKLKRELFTTIMCDKIMEGLEADPSRMPKFRELVERFDSKAVEYNGLKNILETDGENFIAVMKQYDNLKDLASEDLTVDTAIVVALNLKGRSKKGISDLYDIPLNAQTDHAVEDLKKSANEYLGELHKEHKAFFEEFFTENITPRVRFRQAYIAINAANRLRHLGEEAKERDWKLKPSGSSSNGASGPERMVSSLLNGLRKLSTKSRSFKAPLLKDITDVT